MFREAVKITVCADGGKFAKIVTIMSDGSYITVNREVSKYVGREFKGMKVSEFFWQYV